MGGGRGGIPFCLGTINLTISFSISNSPANTERKCNVPGKL